MYGRPGAKRLASAAGGDRNRASSIGGGGGGGGGGAWRGRARVAIPSRSGPLADAATPRPLRTTCA
ncbi:MAG: hypothetical protein IPF73_17160 [Betaproteobacteria bacterium]|nr:hypothetical protein [Betaproteobacteria bacterium]